MTKIITILGARPQFIKAAVVSRALRSTPGVKEILIHTGQHFDPEMSDIFFKELNIPLPDHHLGISGGGHGAMTGAMLQKMEPLLQDIAPDWVLVYGDTNSTLAGALAASKLHIPVAHVEAGLRSFNRSMPEEINRVLTDHIAELLFAPTERAVRNLLHEGIPEVRIQLVGDVMYDAAHYYRDKARQPEGVVHDGGFILATVHRAENTDDPKRLSNIIGALNDIAADMPVIMPLHPRTRKILTDKGYDTQGIILLNPVGYLQMLWLLLHCRQVFTDSGGLQKEAYFFGKLCVTMRDETEWVELVDSGWNVLVGAKREDIVNAVLYAWDHAPRKVLSLYGHGDAGKRIAHAF